MKILLTILTGMLLASCTTKNYKATDYANACVSRGEDSKTSHVCMPIDTYDNKLRFHSMRPSEMRKMPNMSDVMD